MVTDPLTTKSLTSNRRAERLLEASRLLHSTLEVAELTHIVLRIVQDEIPVDRCTLFVVDRKQNLLRSFIAQGVEKFEITLPIGQGLAGTVAATGEALDVEDAYADERFQAKFDNHLGYRTMDVLCMPVLNREDAVIGVLELLNRQRPLDGEDKKFLSSICTYIGLALHNAWIHRELLESQRSEQELGLVRDRLAQVEKRLVMSELVAGIVHEIRNPLSVALGQCTLLRDDGGHADSTTDRLEKVEASIRQALKVATNFLAFAREAGNKQIPSDINSIIAQTVDLLAYDFRSRGVAVRLDLETLPLLKLDPGNIQQVLLNLLKNAQQAAGEGKTGGTVTVRSLYDAQRRVIRIELKDNGPGIPAGIQSRIFEPFFTTKPREMGTGLGLAVSKRIIEQNKGRLSFESAVGHGTTFVIELSTGESRRQLTVAAGDSSFEPNDKADQASARPALPGNQSVNE